MVQHTLYVQQFKQPGGSLFISDKATLGQGSFEHIATDDRGRDLFAGIGTGGLMFLIRIVKGTTRTTKLLIDGEDARQTFINVAMQIEDDDQGSEKPTLSELGAMLDLFADAYTSEITINSHRFATLSKGDYPLGSTFVTLARLIARKQ